MTPIDVAIAVHSICIENGFGSPGINAPHGEMSHLPTSTLYAEAINDHNLNVTPFQVRDAIIAVAGWDQKSPWPGHPNPQEVVKYLRNYYG